MAVLSNVCTGGSLCSALLPYHRKPHYTSLCIQEGQQNALISITSELQTKLTLSFLITDILMGDHSWRLMGSHCIRPTGSWRKEYISKGVRPAPSYPHCPGSLMDKCICLHGSWADGAFLPPWQEMLWYLSQETDGHLRLLGYPCFPHPGGLNQSFEFRYCKHCQDWNQPLYVYFH